MNRAQGYLERLLVSEALQTRSEMLFSRRVKKWEVDETFLTSRLILQLSKNGAEYVYADRVPGLEMNHGADLELWLRGGGFYLGLRLQAKSLKPSQRKKFPNGTYEALHHNIGHDPDRPQIDALLSGTPETLNPGYLFYNALESDPCLESACCSFNGFEKHRGRLGLTVTSANFVKRLREIEPRGRSLEVVLPHSLPLQCLALCGQYRWQAPMPSLPMSAAGALALSGFERLKVLGDPDQAGADRERPIAEGAPIQFMDSEVPSYVRSLVTEGRLPREGGPDCSFVVVLDGR